MKPLLPLFAFLVLGAGVALADPDKVMPNEWDEFRFERLTILKANPDLEKEQDALDAALDAQQDKVNAATIKADPSTDSIIAKVNKTLKSKWDSAAESGKITVAEWQTLRNARAAALKADPALAADNLALLKKREAFNDKLDAALLKADPTVAGFLSKK